MKVIEPPVSVSNTNTEHGTLLQNKRWLTVWRQLQEFDPSRRYSSNTTSYILFHFGRSFGVKELVQVSDTHKQQEAYPTYSEQTLGIQNTTSLHDDLDSVQMLSTSLVGRVLPSDG